MKATKFRDHEDMRDSMIVYKPESLEIEIEDCIKFLKQKQTGDKGIIVDLIPEMDKTLREDVQLNEYSEIAITLDNCPKTPITIRALIDMVKEAQGIRIHNKSMCLSNKTALVRVADCSYNDNGVARELLCTEQSIFETTAFINNKHVSLSMAGGLTLFALINHFKEFYGGLFESFTELDYFVKIGFEEELSVEEVYELVYAYLFELSSSHNQNYKLKDFYFEEFFEEPELELLDDFLLRPLLIGKGMDNVIRLFYSANSVVDNADFSIIQFTKILEYISRTAVRAEINEKTLNKLQSKRALKPDANYIRELEKFFIETGKKFEDDREAIAVTIKACCDLAEISAFVPRYLGKVKNINNIDPKANREKIIEAAFDQLSSAISDTRNYLSHAKSNYRMKGMECPLDQLGSFAVMMKLTSIQAIRWFGNVSDANRVT
ncbi:hypothetical protein NQU17_00765 [Clostridiaceae bacterium HFYG-1003]|nr:hypothetical protein NQU17_00765 [Clostridiaceae bacterium HFYG-1003]